MANGTYAGTDDFPALVRYAEDGEEPNETVMVFPPVEDLADRTTYLKARTDALETYVGAGSVVRVLAASPFADPADWAPSAASAQLLWTTLTTLQRKLKIPIELPHGVTLTQARVEVLPAGGHGGLPATMPRLRVLRSGPALLGTASDTSASVPAYEAGHYITVSGLSVVIDRTTFEYFLEIESEAGANAVAGLQLHRTEITYTAVT